MEPKAPKPTSVTQEDVSAPTARAMPPAMNEVLMPSPGMVTMSVESTLLSTRRKRTREQHADLASPDVRDGSEANGERETDRRGAGDHRERHGATRCKPGEAAITRASGTDKVAE